MAEKSFQTGHIGINVTNLGRSQKFYQDVFELELIGGSTEDNRRFAFLGSDSQIVLTLWQQSEGRFDDNSPGLHHLSFQVDSIETVKKTEKRLQSLNVPLLYDGIVPHTKDAESGGIFFEDPDGIRLEIFSPTGANDNSVATTEGPACGFF